MEWIMRTIAFPLNKLMELCYSITGDYIGAIFLFTLQPVENLAQQKSKSRYLWVHVWDWTLMGKDSTMWFLEWTHGPWIAWKRKELNVCLVSLWRKYRIKRWRLLLMLRNSIDMIWSKVYRYMRTGSFAMNSLLQVTKGSALLFHLKF